ncbi:MAG: hypothetical protein AAFQ66_13150 [Pseudomonadota bacterium]
MQRQGGLWAGLLLGLAGCGQIGEFELPDLGMNFAARPASNSVEIPDRNVTVAGPAGFCIDRRSSKLRQPAPFVILGSCTALSNRAPQQSTPAALLTATVAPGGNAPPEAFQNFFSTEAGRAALAEDGDPAKVEINDSRVEDGVFLMHLKDRGLSDFPALSTDRWRAVFSLNNSVVAATVVGMEGHQMSSDDGMRLALAFARQVQRASQ